MLEALTIGGPPAGWLAVFLACLAGPRLGRASRASRRGRPSRAAAVTAVTAPEAGAIPPAVVALLAARGSIDLFMATLLDLAHRGWFRVEPPDNDAPDNDAPDNGAPGRPGPVMCVLASRTPSGPLTPYERQAIEHTRQRAGPAGQVPADALTDGFEGGEEKFLKAFRAEVLADARHRGLTRPTLSKNRKALLVTLALIPPGLLLLAHPRLAVLGWSWFYWAILCGITASVSSERLTRAGQDALATWQVHAVATGDNVYSAALGLTSSPFKAHGQNVAWSGFGDTWRQVTIPDATERVWPGITLGAMTVLILLVMPGIPLFGVLGWQLIPGGHGAELGILTAIVLIVIRFARAVNRWTHLPRFSEFDGLILRQWQVENDEQVTHYVAIDDGTSPQAWAFEVPTGLAAALAPGTLVHVRVNPRLNKPLSLEPLRRLQSAPQES